MSRINRNTRLLLSGREAAAALSISEGTLYSRVPDGTLPCVRLAGRHAATDSRHSLC